jgi:eukaryotic-like serine/threonine-protein kinase
VNLAAGSIIAGKYRVESVLGVGGMGQVLLASHIHLQQRVAIKILLAEMLSNQSTVERFLREAQSTVRLRGEHIARVIDVGTLTSGQPFMVMEYLDGADLGQILHHYGPQPSAVVVDLMLQACEGLAEAHAMGIVHRDLKPSNFFATRRPDGSTLLKILDFGISKSGHGAVTDQTGTQTILGTPSYMAPEQMRQSRGADARSDVWSLGVVMYQLISGQLPFKADTFADLVIKACMEQPVMLEVAGAPGLAHIVMHCLEKDPAQRPASAVDLAAMLAAFAADPLAAQAIVERCRRVSQATIHANAVSGSDPQRPLPLAMPPLTPPSWSNQSNQGSVTGAAGQMPAQRQSTTTYWMTIATLAVVAVSIAIWLGNRSSKESVSSTPLAPSALPVLIDGAPLATSITVDAASNMDARIFDASNTIDSAPANAPTASSPTAIAPADAKSGANQAKAGEGPKASVKVDGKQATPRPDKAVDKNQTGKTSKANVDSVKKVDKKKPDDLDFGSRN